MDAGMFAKMKVKPGAAARVFNPPPGYPRDAGLVWDSPAAPGFVHLFVESRAQFEAHFAQAAAAAGGALFWLSYPKAAGKARYDINRDSLWDLVLPKGWHPVAQVSLDERWSAIRLKKNERGREYARPGGTRLCARSSPDGPVPPVPPPASPASG